MKNKLIKSSILFNSKRTISFILLSIFVSFTLFFTTFMILGMKSGLGSLSNRLGADMILVPEGYDSKITTSILRGEPNTFYFSSEILDRLENIDGITNFTPQVYLATLNAGCCSFPLQIIGIDMKSDFVVTPWLKETIKSDLSDNEIIVGSNIVGDINNSVLFFGKEFKIKSHLEKTGMGFDNSVFMNIDSVRALSREYEKILNSPLSKADNLISSVMLRVSHEHDIFEVRKQIQDEFKGEGVYALSTQKFFSDVSKNIYRISKYIFLLIALIYILSIVIYFILNKVSLEYRKKEIVTYKIFGASKKYVKSIFFKEALSINFWGSMIGTVLGLLSAVLFFNLIKSSLGLPYLIPDIKIIIFMFLAVVMVCTILPSIYTKYIISKIYTSENLVNESK